MEVAETEELFRHPMHPYTRSLLSAVPVPDPLIEKTKRTFVFDQSRLFDYEGEQPSLEDVGGGHLVFGSPAEIGEYRRKRALRKEDAE